jgi:predicted dehydrogenase
MNTENAVLSQTRRAFLKKSALAAGTFTLAGCATPWHRAAVPRKLAPNEKANVAVIGLGGQGKHDMKQVIGCGENIVALCDVDEEQLAKAVKEDGAAVAKAKLFTDYRRLFDEAAAFDAVLIATPDHWHAPLCKVALQAGKHVYCEKPLTHTIGEARMLRELARESRAVTQMGNQGSASASFRRAWELIQAGAIGEVRDVHAWLGDHGPARDRPEGTDPVPAGFNWDFWCGPAPLRPYKRGEYHPFTWRNWYDFGNGILADFGCHIFNLPLRALALDYPKQIELVSATGLGHESCVDRCRLRLHFGARGTLPPVMVHWYNGGEAPDDALLQDITTLQQKKPQHGCLFCGSRGTLFTNPWNDACLIKLQGEEKFHGVLGHEATKHIPQTLPRSPGHVQDWVLACKGGPKVFSDFDFGGHLTEITLSAVLALRTGRSLDWDGAQMRATNAPEAAQFVQHPWRPTWLV